MGVLKDEACEIQGASRDRRPPWASGGGAASPRTGQLDCWQVGPVPGLGSQSSGGQGQEPRRRVEAGRILGLGHRRDGRRGRETGAF